jgi:hypothetical protein
VDATVLEGSLARRCFAQILLQAYRERWNGTLIVDPKASGHEDDRILFLAGEPHATRSAERADTVEDALLALICRREQFAYYEGLDLVSGLPGVRRGHVDPLRLVARSLRGPSRDDAVAAFIGRIGESVPLRLTAPEELDRLDLLPHEGELVWSLESQDLSLAELRERSSLPAPIVDRVVFLLIVARTVRVVSRKRSAVPPPVVSARRDETPTPAREAPPALRILSGAGATRKAPSSLPPHPSGVFGVVDDEGEEATPGKGPPTVSLRGRRRTGERPGLAVDPDREAARALRRARRHMRREEWHAALTELTLALRDAPDNAELLVAYAWCLSWLHHDDTAPLGQMIAAVDKALMLDPNHDRASYVKGMILLRAGDADSAATWLHRAVAINPGNTHAERALDFALACRGHADYPQAPPA